MEINKINEWPSTLVSLIRNVIYKKETIEIESSKPNTLQKKKIISSPKEDLFLARTKLLEGLTDLNVVLESYYSLYSCEVSSKTALCEYYQEQAIQITTLIKSQYMKEPHTLEIACELLQQSDMFKLFHTLAELKNYRDELPSGWYESIKLPINHISKANQIYQRLRNEISN